MNLEKNTNKKKDDENRQRLKQSSKFEKEEELQNTSKADSRQYWGKAKNHK